MNKNIKKLAMFMALAAASSVSFSGDEQRILEKLFEGLAAEVGRAEKPPRNLKQEKWSKKLYANYKDAEAAVIARAWQAAILNVDPSEDSPAIKAIKKLNVKYQRAHKLCKEDEGCKKIMIQNGDSLELDEE